MKFSTYNPQVQLNNGGNASVQVSSNLLAYGDNGMGAGALAKGMQQAMAGIEQYNERQDKQNYTDAMNAFYQEQYNMMSQDTDKAKGFLNRQLKDAEGAGLQYQEATKKLQADIEKIYKFSNPSYKMALQTAMQSATFDGFKQVQNVEHKEIEKYKGVQVKENIQNLAKMASISTNPEQTKFYFAECDRTIDRTYGNESAENIALRKQMSKGVIAREHIKGLINRKDYQGAKDGLTNYGQYLDANEYSALSKQIDSSQKTTSISDIANDFINNKGYDLSKCLEEFDKMTMASSIPEQKEGTTWYKNSNVILDGLTDNAKKAISVVAYIYNKQFGEQMALTSAMDGKHKEHDGNAIDIDSANGSTALDKKEDRDRFITELAKYGITVYDEYENDSEDKTADHLHLRLANFKDPGEQKYSREDKETFLKECSYQKELKNKIIKSQMETFESQWRPQVVEWAKTKDGLQMMNNAIAQYEEDKFEHKILQQLKREFFGGKSATNGKNPSDKQVGDWGRMLQNGQFRIGLNETERENGTLQHNYLLGQVTERSRFMEYVKSLYGDNSIAIGKAEKLYSQYLSGEGQFAIKDKELTSLVNQTMQNDKFNFKGAKLEQEREIRKTTAYEFIREQLATGKGMPSSGEIVQAISKRVIPITQATYKVAEKSWADFEGDEPDETIVGTYKASQAEMDRYRVRAIEYSDDGKLLKVTRYDKDGLEWVQFMTTEELDMLLNRW